MMNCRSLVGTSKAFNSSSKLIFWNFGTWPNPYRPISRERIALR